MQNLGLDFETYFDDDVSLRKMKAAEYIRHPDFFVHGAAISWKGKEQWLGYTALRKFLAKLDSGDVQLIGHNLNFDGLILWELFGFFPGRYFDTMYAARYVFPELRSVRLSAVAEELGIEGKSDDVVKFLKGVKKLTGNLRKRTAEYAMQDIKATVEIHDILAPLLPQKVKDVMHVTTRMGAVPTLEIDRERMAMYRDMETTATKNAIKSTGVNPSVLRSDQQFAGLLESLGVEVPRKKSETTGQMIPALAKGDVEYARMKILHPETELLFKARERARSSISVSRSESFLRITQHRRTIPLPYMAFGATTRRWSGRDGINVQNMPRDSEMRRSLVAPENHVIIAGDSSQIELRMNAWFCGEQWMLDILNSGRDIYRETAARTFGVQADTIAKDSTERMVGKVQELALGYGCGAPTFHNQIEVGLMGADPIHVNFNTVQRWVHSYRENHPYIVNEWYELNERIQWLTTPDVQEYKGCLFMHEAIQLPHGFTLEYPGLKYDHEYGWYYGPSRRKLYGGLLLENIIQSLAWGVIVDQLLAADSGPLLHVVGTTHDEIITTARRARALKAAKALKKAMSTSPEWCSDLVLQCTLKVKNYYAK